MLVAERFRLNSTALKLIAILAMFVDHASFYLIPKGTTADIVVHSIGRLAAPIMCYLLAEGYFYTSNRRKYAKRLLWFALLSHFPFVWFFGLEWWQATSVMWSLLMGLIALSVCKNDSMHLLVKLPLLALCCLLAWTADWNFIAVLWIVAFGLFRGNQTLQMLSFAAIGTVFYIVPGLMSMGLDASFRFGIWMAIPIFYLYNGKPGKRSPLMKWGFYVFYPLHLLVLYVLYQWIWNG
ncbi:hypothetical protein HGI30_12765 [Paenibacillus albicereus]|uniref:Conjugal transfer protein TraX n=2 Tax=Paenibacillus albicereus TaxID=2726185 RepID=A0A6H2H4K6_9BACL|nr:hypothetical protein HGI30_12765 [Paenibacillus albicereus]